MILKTRDGHFCGGGDQLKINSPGIALTSRILVGGGKGAIEIKLIFSIISILGTIVYCNHCNVLVVMNNVDVFIIVLIDPLSM